jgi:hypothetical protein
MPEDARKWEQRQREESAIRVQQATTPASSAPAVQNVGFTPTGFGADSVFANTPSGPEDKGTLTKFENTGTLTKYGKGDTGAVKTMVVGEPIKTEPLP